MEQKEQDCSIRDRSQELRGAHSWQGRGHAIFCRTGGRQPGHTYR